MLRGIRSRIQSFVDFLIYFDIIEVSIEQMSSEDSTP